MRASTAGVCRLFVHKHDINGHRASKYRQVPHAGHFGIDDVASGTRAAAQTLAWGWWAEEAGLRYKGVGP